MSTNRTASTNLDPARRARLIIACAIGEARRVYGHGTVPITRTPPTVAADGSLYLGANYLGTLRGDSLTLDRRGFDRVRVNLGVILADLLAEVAA
jgi:hypothetical protein